MRRTRKQTNDRFGEVVAAVQAGHDEFVPQIQYGHEAVRGAEQAAICSSDALKHTSGGLERANREAQFIQQQIDFNLDRIGRALKKRKIKQLERFKTEINLVEYAISLGYEYLRNESSPSSAVLHHDSGDKILVATDQSDRGLYFSFKNDWDKGTIIDFVQHRHKFNLGEVRKELRSWLIKGDEVVKKPKPTSRERVSERLQRLKYSNQLSPQTSEVQKPKQKKRRQLEM